MIKLRGWQRTALPVVAEEIGKGEAPWPAIEVATGGGKTVFGITVAADIVRRGGRVLWVAHRRELIKQPLETLKWVAPDLKSFSGTIMGSQDEHQASIMFASIQSLATKGRAEKVGKVNLVIVDECHHSVSRSYRKVFERLGNPPMLGLSATMDRSDGKDLGELWRIIYTFSILDAIRDGVLLPPYVAANPIPYLGITEDMDEEALEEALLEAHIVDHTVNAVDLSYNAVKLPLRDDKAFLSCHGRAGLVFTLRVKQAKLTATALREAGWKADYVSGKTPKKERDKKLADFESGRIDILCNAGVLTEGTDLPRASFAVLARPYGSWTLFVQSVGRALRVKTDKEEEHALIIDLVGAAAHNSLIGAPVLIGKPGDGCPLDPVHGKHVYQPDGEHGGICSCGHKVSCIKSRTHSHIWKDGRCKVCGDVQCPDAPDGEHAWMPWEGALLRCMFCGTERPAPLATLIDRKNSEPTPVNWMPLTSHIRFAEFKGVGIVYETRSHQGSMLHWADVRRKKMQRVTPSPVATAEADILVADIARRATPVEGDVGGYVRDARWRKARAGVDAFTIAREGGILNLEDM